MARLTTATTGHDESACGTRMVTFLRTGERRCALEMAKNAVNISSFFRRRIEDGVTPSQQVKKKKKNRRVSLVCFDQKKEKTLLSGPSNRYYKTNQGLQQRTTRRDRNHGQLLGNNCADAIFWRR